MRSLCRIGCGHMLEYESHKFSDGFEYLFPKDLDGKPHDCTLFNIVHSVTWEGIEFEMNVMYEHFKKGLDISYEKFEEIIRNATSNSGFEILGPGKGRYILYMLRIGLLDKLIAGQQLDMSTRTLPFLKYRNHDRPHDFRFI